MVSEMLYGKSILSIENVEAGLLDSVDNEQKICFILD